MNSNIFWYVMYKLFKKRRPIPKELLDFDEVYESTEEGTKK